jgi:CHAT domain-containing protein
MRNQRAFSSAVVVGNPAMPMVTTETGDTVRLIPLPGAEREGRSVAMQLGVASSTGSQATETSVRSKLATAPLVHLATHAFAYASDAKARSSFVALSPGAGNDGLLTVGEILDDPAIRIAADLVVLSACQTGLGDLKRAEGTVGLQRAFLAKGARSVLVSLWNVSDDATELLMQRYYHHWLDDPDHPSKAEALRRAQENVRTTKGFADPRYWAAFQLVGAR